MAAPLLLYGIGFIVAVETDRLGGKRTLVARRGRAEGFSLLGAAFTLGSVAFLLLGAWPPDGWPAVWPVALGSLVPARVSAWGALRRPLDRAPATRLVNAVLVSFVGLVALADGYVVWAIWKG
jgi:1,4-dihydroxy-2-naphthoate octaprenyltransferase